MSRNAIDRPSMKAGLKVEQTEEGALVEDPSLGRIHYLNPTAAYALSLCDGHNSPERIIELIKSHFALSDPPNILVEEILQQFAQEGLITMMP